MEKHLPLHLGMVAIEKGAFRSLMNKVANFTNLLTICENEKHPVGGAKNTLIVSPTEE